MTNRHDELNPELSQDQIATALSHFAETLAVAARVLEAERPGLAKATLEASRAMLHLAPDIARADSDVAMEILKSSARLVSSVRAILPRRSLH
ncbi:hypothetical protein ASE04_19145 [Rhizobium sp. Root708]|nr:hypothetical protein ASE04_19145 [Rhizobium sp. Root708]